MLEITVLKNKLRDHLITVRIYKYHSPLVLLDSLIQVLHKMTLKKQKVKIDYTFNELNLVGIANELSSHLRMIGLNERVDLEEFNKVYSISTSNSKHISGIKEKAALILYLYCLNSKASVIGESGFQSGRSATVMKFASLNSGIQAFQFSLDIRKLELPEYLVDNNFRLITIKNFKKDVKNILKQYKPSFWFSDGDNRYFPQKYELSEAMKYSNIIIVNNCQVSKAFLLLHNNENYLSKFYYLDGQIIGIFVKKTLIQKGSINDF